MPDHPKPDSHVYEKIYVDGNRVSFQERFTRRACYADRLETVRRVAFIVTDDDPEPVIGKTYPVVAYSEQIGTARLIPEDATERLSWEVMLSSPRSGRC